MLKNIKTKFNKAKISSNESWDEIVDRKIFKGTTVTGTQTKGNPQDFGRSGITTNMSGEINELKCFEENRRYFSLHVPFIAQNIYFVIKL